MVDGAFTGIEASYYDVNKQPHCLSQRFRDDAGNLGIMDRRTLRPDSIDEVLSLDNYETFVKEMESRVHDTIPFGIGGDGYGRRLVVLQICITSDVFLSNQREEETRREHVTSIGIQDIRLKYDSTLLSAK